MENGKFNPAIELDGSDRSSLAATCATDGYEVIHKIMRSEVDKFLLAHINKPAEDKEAVFSSFLLSKAATQFYEGVTKRINTELLQFQLGHGVTKPTDDTEGVLDIGELASTVHNVPNFFGEGDALLDD